MTDNTSNFGRLSCTLGPAGMEMFARVVDGALKRALHEARVVLREHDVMWTPVSEWGIMQRLDAHDFGGQVGSAIAEATRQNIAGVPESEWRTLVTDVAREAGKTAAHEYVRGSVTA